MPWPEGWLIQNCLRRKCGILIHTCAFRPCLTFCRCSPQISLDGPMPSEALACLIKWQCEADERSRRTSAKGHLRRFEAVCDESGLPPTPDVLLQHSEPALRTRRRHPPSATTRRCGSLSIEPRGRASRKNCMSTEEIMIRLVAALVSLALISPASAGTKEDAFAIIEQFKKAYDASDPPSIVKLFAAEA